MLFINKYDKALQYHRDLMVCWLKVKILGLNKNNKTKNCGYCNKNTCQSLSLRSHNHIFNQNTIGFFTNTVIEQLVTGEPHVLVTTHNSFKAQITDATEVSEIIKLFKISGYENYLQKYHSIEILKKLNRSTCTYCNRNYTLNISKNHASAQFDHWFPKDKFPLLSISFFNLIPSCGSCNHIKGRSQHDEDWWVNLSLNKMLHPYFEEEDSNFKFTYILDTYDKLSVDFRNINGLKMKNTLEFNKTKDIYNAHAELELRDLFNLRKKYSNNYLDYLLNDVLNDIAIDDKYRLLFGIENKSENYHKRPMSKFKSDIIEKLLNL